MFRLARVCTMLLLADLFVLPSTAGAEEPVAHGVGALECAGIERWIERSDFPAYGLLDQYLLGFMDAKQMPLRVLQTRQATRRVIDLCAGHPDWKYAEAVDAFLKQQR